MLPYGTASAAPPVFPLQEAVMAKKLADLEIQKPSAKDEAEIKGGKFAFKGLARKSHAKASAKATLRSAVRASARRAD